MLRSRVFAFTTAMIARVFLGARNADYVLAPCASCRDEPGRRNRSLMLRCWRTHCSAGPLQWVAIRDRQWCKMEPGPPSRPKSGHRTFALPLRGPPQPQPRSRRKFPGYLPRCRFEPGARFRLLGAQAHKIYGGARHTAPGSNARALRLPFDGTHDKRVHRNNHAGRIAGCNFRSTTRGPCVADRKRNKLPGTVQNAARIPNPRESGPSVQGSNKRKWIRASLTKKLLGWCSL